MNDLYLFGASGHGKVVKDIAFTNNQKVVAFFDDNPKEKFLDNIPVFSTNKDGIYSGKNFVICIGDNRIRKEISIKLKSHFVSLIHSSVILSSTVEVGLGTVIMAGSIINADAILGNHVIINTNAVIEHDCKLSNYVHISPNATVTGNVSIGEGTHIGSGAILIPNVTIGKWVTIGAGAVVISDVPDYAVVVGNPGKIIKYNKI